MSTIAPYGTWKSPITSDLIVARSVGLGQITMDGDDVYWLESYGSEDGRAALVRPAPGGGVVEVTPLSFNLRTRVHEYGGGCYSVVRGVLHFSNLADGRVYRQEVSLGGAGDAAAGPRAVTPEGRMRFADFAADADRGLLYCIREEHPPADHGAAEAVHVVNTIVALHEGGDERGGEIIVSGSDFYSTPRLSPDGKRLAWLTWNHPNMPWNGTELWVGELDGAGTVVRSELVAGGVDESIFQPEWSPDGRLYFVSDRSGWWNLYRTAMGSARAGAVEPIAPMQAEFGSPQWLFGMSTYAFESARRIICTYVQRGRSRLASIDTRTLELIDYELPFWYISGVRALRGRALFLGASPAAPEAVAALDPDSARWEALRRSTEVQYDPRIVSMPEEVVFPTAGGAEAYALFYPPANPEFTAPPGERPPVIVMSHGGPTASALPIFRLDILYWTSRGFSVLDVNYGGSTGYGRAYRKRLEGQWGVVDVEDCIRGAQFLAGRGRVDGERLIITGGSSGGYTTLCALTFHDVFKAGACYYGISDLEALVRDTHKFESRYLDSLIGPYPEQQVVYRERSPIHFADRLSCPLILFQGSLDAVVPPEQSRMMYDAVRSKGIPVAYLEFEGERHGFRKAENITRSIDAELSFYGRVFGFVPAGALPALQIDNL